ncbi:MAG: hypothetical protein JXB30_12245 [Anaerolineae bacterium]|nr:hypothetical protein [Anaerolineae bacterium]
MSISLPGKVQLLVNEALAEMDADPQHRLAHQRRRQIYDAFKRLVHPPGQRACGWLAVITARRVLPLFQQEYPEDTLPQDLLDAAIGALQGSVDDEAADDLQDEGYHASGNTWGYDEMEITWNADLAGRAAYHALKEARGQVPLSNLDRIHTLGEVSFPSGEFSEYPQPIRGDQFTDEDLCGIESSDAAAAAAVAFACRPDGPLCDPSKLREFWTWWLTEAVPEAWETAQE